MPISESAFAFGEYDGDRSAGAFLLPVARNIRDKNELMSHYAKAGRFPSYFGKNWDALNDCLRDLSWIADETVVILHADLPLMDKRDEARIYVEILESAITFWKSHPQHKVIVIFPRETEIGVNQLIDLPGVSRTR